jgi:filamentous hemagglutinin family protein
MVSNPLDGYPILGIELYWMRTSETPMALKNLRLGLVTIGLFWCGPVVAQIIPDASLGLEQSQVVPAQILRGTLSEQIEGGAVRGGNLFHSFQQFNVRTGEGVYFANPAGVTNILTRVTGGSISQIDGVVGVLGNANLFLLNPQGILFGDGARLDLGGSFVGTTADRIKFADGVEFSAAMSGNAPLLTVSVPVGLGMGSQSGSIQVQGNGHHIFAPDPLFAPYLVNQPETGLAVQPNQTIALLGSTIALDGGLLAAEGGRVELGAVKAPPGTSNQVGLDFTDSGLNLNYDGIGQWGDIQLRGRSLVNVSGFPAGSIQVRGDNIQIQDSSVFWSQNRSSQAAGRIVIQAAGDLILTGNSPATNIRSDILSETLAPGSSGEIDIKARQVRIEDGGGIRNRSFSPGDSGAIRVWADQGVNLYGTLETDNINRTAQIATFTANVGNSGEILINTPHLELNNAGFLVGSTFGLGTGSTITVNARQIAVNGVSYLESGSYGPGQSGNVVLNTGKLDVTDGARVTTTSFDKAKAGNVFVNATESINVTGGRFVSLPALQVNEFFPSKILSAAAIPYLVIQRAVGLGPIPAGNAGTVKLTAPRLSVTNHGLVGVQNEGTGRGGFLDITAGSIYLTQRGTLNATTVSGQGGDIMINADSLLLRHQSNITATANSKGDGGNIELNIPMIVGLENSDIIANAFQGRGGNIKIKTQGILGLEYRDQLTPDSDITASSEFGINGNVQVSEIGIAPNVALISLPVDIVDPSQKIATGCEQPQSSSLIATGRGGIPEDVSKQVLVAYPWLDTRAFSGARSGAARAIESPVQDSGLVEASTLQINTQGQLELLAQALPITAPIVSTCAKK